MTLLSRIGGYVLGSLRRVLPHGGFLTPSRRLNDILLSAREWRAGWGRGEPLVRVPAVEATELTVLAGDLSRGEEALEAAAGLTRKGSAQVLGFRFGGSMGSSSGAVRVDELAGCAFPDFFGVLAAAFTRIAGRSLVALDADLLGLGLGLLCNYHIGRPVYFAGGKALGGTGPEEVDWGDRAYLDPVSGAWTKILSRFRGRVPVLPAGEFPPNDGVSVLPASREFAELFAAFYESTRRRA